ncbi:hypothetical protein P7245_22250 [Vibrio parahaemolyticus]|nr:hypothetical protein [Vibrio parahaemolyticus]
MEISELVKAISLGIGTGIVTGVVCAVFLRKQVLNMTRNEVHRLKTNEEVNALLSANVEKIGFEKVDFQSHDKRQIERKISKSNPRVYVEIDGAKLARDYDVGDGKFTATSVIENIVAYHYPIAKLKRTIDFDGELLTSIEIKIFNSMKAKEFSPTIEINTCGRNERSITACFIASNEIISELKASMIDYGFVELDSKSDGEKDKNED